VRRFRLAAVLVGTGLTVEGATLLSSSAAAFVVFAAAGVSLVVAGFCVYLWAAATR
jgi:hypothetical protein